MPQIMKMKNSGLVLYIKPINIQYLKKVSEVLKNKFNISMWGITIMNKFDIEYNKILEKENII
jgi:hypothetical protein